MLPYVKESVFKEFVYYHQDTPIELIKYGVLTTAIELFLYSPSKRGIIIHVYDIDIVSYDHIDEDAATLVRCNLLCDVIKPNLQNNVVRINTKTHHIDGLPALRIQLKTKDTKKLVPEAVEEFHKLVESSSQDYLYFFVVGVSFVPHISKFLFTLSTESDVYVFSEGEPLDGIDANQPFRISLSPRPHLQKVIDMSSMLINIKRQNIKDYMLANTDFESDNHINN